MNRILYQFPTSPFSRRVRLALHHKNLATEFRDARANPLFLEEARRQTPVRTVPVLVEEEGEVRRALGDSSAITRYLDAAYPHLPSIWPHPAQLTDPAQEAFVVSTVTTLVDIALNHLIDLGTRYFALRENPKWPGIKDEMLGRAQSALDTLAHLAASAGGSTLTSAGWSAPDMWLYTAASWLEGLPERAKTFEIAQQIVSLGWRLPPALSHFAEAHRHRE